MGRQREAGYDCIAIVENGLDIQFTQALRNIPCRVATHGSYEILTCLLGRSQGAADCIVRAALDDSALEETLCLRRYDMRQHAKAAG